MIVLAIFSMVAIFSFPAFRQMISETNDTLLQSQLLHLLQLAKNTAQETQITVSICGTKSMKHCDGDWSDGLLAFIDRHENGVVSDQADILSIVQFKDGKGKLYWRSFPSNSQYLRFLPRSYVAADNGMFWFCEERNRSPAFAITISVTGMVRALFPNKSGAIRNSRGKVMTCPTSNH